MLEGALRLVGDKWQTEPRQLPESYEAWIDAQLFSKEASDRWLTFADLVYPTEKTQKKATLPSLWAKVKEVRHPHTSTCHIMTHSPHRTI